MTMVTSSSLTGGGGGGEKKKKKKDSSSTQISLSSSVTTSVLTSVVDGSFDAAFLVDSQTGKILKVNKPALDLFDATSSPDKFFQNISEFISFWSHSLQTDNGSDNEDEDDEDDNNKKPPGGGGGANNNDMLSWKQVVQYASSPSSNNTSMGQQRQPVREWTVTGTKLSIVRTRSSSQLHGLDDSFNKESGNGGTTGGDDTGTVSSVVTIQSRKTTFPGILKMTAFPNTTFISPQVNDETEPGPEPGPETTTGTGTAWLVYVRHSDHHRILSTASLPSDHSRSGIRRANHQKSSGGSRASAREPPRVTIDDAGIITDINLPTTANSTNAEGWDWITKDLIGKHISEVKKPTTPTPKQEDPDETPIPEGPPGGGPNYFAMAPKMVTTAVKTKDGSNSDTTGTGTAIKKRGSGGGSSHSGGNHKGTGMLDFILKNKINPGHGSVPYSGFHLRTDDFNTALTTGNAIREENITEAAFEAALDPIFQIDEHGTIQMVNSAALKTFGWDRSEFIGSNIAMICGGGHEANHASYMARYLATGDTRVIGKNRKLPAKRKDGSEFPIELGVVEVDTYAGDIRLFCGFVRDLSDLVARERLAQEIVEVALDPMFQIDEEGTILMVNKAALSTFGYNRDELIGENVSIICGGSHGSNHDNYIRRYLLTGDAKLIGVHRELPAKRKNGKEFWIQLAVVELLKGVPGSTNTRRIFCGYIHDLSRQRRDNEIMSGTIDTSLDPVLHINENGIIQMVNNAAMEHLGYSRDELVGENVSLIVGGEHQQNHGKYIRHYLETGEKRAMGKKRKLKARRKDGSEMDIELGLSEITITGCNERMFCAFLTDLSSRETTSSSSKKQSGEDASSSSCS